MFYLSHDHMVEEPCDVMGEFPLLQVTILPSLVVTGVIEEEVFCF